MFGSKDKRFKVVHEEGTVAVTRILQDTQTGVNYLYSAYGQSGGITPLLDRNGNVVVTPIEE